MRIYNPFSRETYVSDYSVSDRVKRKYKSLPLYKGFEDVYYNNTRIVIVVKDERIGRKILPILKMINSFRYTILEIIFKIENVVLNAKRDQVLEFSIKYSCFDSGKIDGKYMLSKFLDSLSFYFNLHLEDNIDLEEIEGISTILAHLTKKVAEKKEYEKRKARLIYYLYFKRDIKKEIESAKDMLVSLPYNCNVMTFKELYRTYTGQYDSADYEFIYEYQLDEYNEFPREVYIDDILSDINIDYGVNKVYIEYNNDTVDYEFISSYIDAVNIYTATNIVSLIYRLDEECTGYRYTSIEDNLFDISENEFKDTISIFDFFNGTVKGFLDKVSFFIKKVNNKAIPVINNPELFNDIELTDLLKIDRREKEIGVKFRDVKSFLSYLHLFQGIDHEVKIAKSTIEIVSKYISNKYGNLDENALRHTAELRLLSTELVDEIINRIMGKEISNTMYKKYKHFVENYSKYSNNAYYTGYRYKDIVFLDEIKSLNLDNIKDEIVSISDTEEFVQITKFKEYFLSKKDKKKRTITSELVRTQDRNVSYIMNNIPDLSKYVVKINRLVYDINGRDKDDNSMYELVGYTREKIDGMSLNEKNLELLDNKELAYLNLNIFRFFSRNNTKLYPLKYIPLEYIYFNRETKEIKIDILNCDLSTKTVTIPSFLKYVQSGEVIPNSLEDRVDKDIKGVVTYKKYEEYCNKRKNYCKKHNLWYEKECKLCAKTQIKLNKLNTLNAKEVKKDDSGIYFRLKGKSKEDILYIKEMYVKDENILSNIYDLVFDVDIRNIQSLYIPERIIYDGDKFYRIYSKISKRKGNIRIKR